MSVNVSLNAVPLSKNLLHMEPKPWVRALRGWGWADLLAASSLEVDGAKGVMVKAIGRWCRAVGLGKYQPKGGWVTAQLCSRGPVSPGRKAARRDK